MMRHVAWIRLLRSAGAGVCAVLLVMAATGRSQQPGANQTTHKNSSAAATVHQQQPAKAAQRPAPAATAPKAAQTAAHSALARQPAFVDLEPAVAAA